MRFSLLQGKQAFKKENVRFLRNCKRLLDLADTNKLSFQKHLSDIEVFRVHYDESQKRIKELALWLAELEKKIRIPSSFPPNTGPENHTNFLPKQLELIAEKFAIAQKASDTISQILLKKAPEPEGKKT